MIRKPCLYQWIIWFQMSDSLLFDTSDDEELREQLDMHSIIVSCVNEEPLFTADQVQRRNQSAKGEGNLELKDGFLLWQ